VRVDKDQHKTIVQGLSGLSPLRGFGDTCLTGRKSLLRTARKHLRSSRCGLCHGGLEQGPPVVLGLSEESRVSLMEDDVATTAGTVNLTRT
jgi:hypothetical protein